MKLKSFFKAVCLSVIPAMLPMAAQAISVTGTFNDVNAWQDSLNNTLGQDFSLENRSLAGLDCSPYTNGTNYSTLGNFCGTGISSQLRVNDILTDPENTLSETNVTTHGIDGSGYSVSYGNTGQKSISVLWTFPEDVQGLFLDFTSSAFTKNTQIAVTGADGLSEVVAVPNGTDTWGFVADAAIKTVEFIATQNGDENFSVASVSLANTGTTTSTTEVPSPLLLPGVGMVATLLLKKKRRSATQSMQG